MRDLVVNAPSRLDALTQQMVDLTARIAPAEQRMTELHNEFDPAALASVATNVDDRQGPAGLRRPEPHPGARSGGQAGQRRAERSGRRRTRRGIGAGTSPLVARRGGQRRQRHSARGRHAAVADRRHPGRYRARRHRSCRARRKPKRRTCAIWPAPGTRPARPSTPPAPTVQPIRSASFTAIDQGRRRLESGCWPPSPKSRRPPSGSTGRLEQALFTAQSRVHAVSEYIDTRRGSIGPEARTRLAEASRQTAKPRKTSGDRPQRSDHPCQHRRDHWPLRPSHWPTTTSDPPSSPTPDATAAATTWAR